MTEYLILSLSRAVPLVWEFNREITFNVTFTRNFGNIPKSHVYRKYSGSGASTATTFRLDSTSKRVLRAFGTPPKPTPAGVADATRPRLLWIGFLVHSWTGSPQFRIDLHYANPNGTPGQLIQSFTPTVVDHGYNQRSIYVDLRPSGGLELEWDTLYSIVLVPILANASNYADVYHGNPAGDPLVMTRIGTSTDSGVTWNLIDNKEWTSYLEDYAAVMYRYNYIASDVAVPIAKSSEAFRSYFNGWASRTTLPSGFVVTSEGINGINNPAVGTEVPFTDAYVHSMTFYTTANITAFTQNDVASFKWRYDVNPVTVDMFYASEAYLQQIDFLGASTSTSSVRLNDSYEQEFSGAGGTSIRFDPPVLWWKAQVLSGAVRLRALVFE